MKSNARCWTPRAAAPLIAMLWLTGCAMGGSETRSLCPPVVKYSTADQVRAAEEVGALPEGAVVIAMLSDDAVLRDQARACRQGRTADVGECGQKAAEIGSTGGSFPPALP